jgi:hypothetical protein
MRPNYRNRRNPGATEIPPLPFTDKTAPVFLDHGKHPRKAMKPFMTSNNHHLHFIVPQSEPKAKGATACAVTPRIRWWAM